VSDDDLRKKLSMAEARLGELMNKCDELRDTNAARVARLTGMIAQGRALEGDLLEAQMEGQSREDLQQNAAINYEEKVVRPLREKVRQLEKAESRAEASKLEREAAEARRELDEFLTRCEHQEQALRERVSFLENASAKAQRRGRGL